MRSRAISLLVEAISFLVACKSVRVAFSSSFKGFTMFSTSIRVAFSVLVMRTVSASAFAFSASALALRTVAFMVATATTSPIRPVPRRMLRISLKDIAVTGLFGCYWFIPIDLSHFCTSKLGQALAATSLWPMMRTSGKRR